MSNSGFSRVEGLGGSSPALAVQCPVCKATAGVYCTKANGERQIVAHKKRSQAARAELQTKQGRTREEFLNDLRASQVAARLKMLTPDPPLPPPVEGVEPAPAFAERLAQKFIIFGSPPPGLVIEIAKAVRERDGAIVKAKDEEQYAASMRAAQRTR